MSRHAEIADVVVAAINGAAIITGATAVRKAFPKAKREELTTASLQVIASTFACEAADRTRVRAHYGVDVGVQQAVNPDDLDAFDEMLDWLPAIRALFEADKHTLALDGTSAKWEKTETVAGADAGYAPEHLESQQVFTAVLRFTFMVLE